MTVSEVMRQGVRIELRGQPRDDRPLLLSVATEVAGWLEEVRPAPASA